MASFKKIAHRGASGDYPENTRVAFEKAIEARADMIELDCQLSQDGHVVVFHDERLTRTTGVRGAVKNRTLAQLKKLDIGQWRKKSFKGERILTLEEALEIIVGDVNLCLEIKSFPASAPGIELKILFILSHYDYLDRTILSSFDFRTLARVRELAPEAALGIIYGSSQGTDPLVAAGSLAWFSIHARKNWPHAIFWRGLGTKDWTFMFGRSTRRVTWKRWSRWECKG